MRKILFILVPLIILALWNSSYPEYNESEGDSTPPSYPSYPGENDDDSMLAKNTINIDAIRSSIRDIQNDWTSIKNQIRRQKNLP